MNLKQLFFYIILFIPFIVSGQNIEGSVYGKDGNKTIALPGAVVRWLNTDIGTTTSLDGKFSLTKPESIDVLVVSFLGYTPDTLIVRDNKGIKVVLISDSYNIGEVEITKKLSGTMMSKISPQTKEIINSRELLKAACCNLSESFETNPAVDVNFTDAVTGAKQIRMLGLQGTYVQMMQENMPTLRGLAGPYGLSYVPGTSIESIQLSKGAGSVVNGYESMAGQINLEMIKPHNPDKWYFNLYGDANSRAEANVNFAKELNEKWGTALLVHGDGLFNRFDQNKDGFMDMPLSQQFNAFNRWQYYDGKKLESQFGVNALVQSRLGGQMNFDPAKDKFTSNAYGIGINTQRLEAFAKAGLVFPEKPWKSFGSQFSGTYHAQDAYFGMNKYNGVQETFYTNLIYQSILGTTSHKIKAGSSFLLDDFDENYNDSSFLRTEIVPGIFSEYSYTSVNEKLSLVTGARLDQHNIFGLMFTPRVHGRYSLTDNITLRASAGKGYRTPNVFIENAALWASSRKVIFMEKPSQEESWNYGGSLLYNFKLRKKEGYITADFFRTNFINQLVVDVDYNPQQVLIYNLKGRSYSNSYQLEFNYEPVENLDVKMAGKWQDVFTEYHGELLRKPLVSQYRVLLSTSYSTRYDKWEFNLTGMRNGPSRIPATDANPVAYQLKNYSPAYYRFNVQITKNFKKWSLYGGAENFTNFRQPNPILAANDPFGPYFDASMVWGPVEGGRIYAGLRYKIPSNH